MNNTITLTAEQMEALSKGQSITIEPPKPAITKWEPKENKYVLELLTDTIHPITNTGCINPTLTYQTQTQAEQAAKALRSYARQLAWVAENDDGWVADWENRNQSKHYVEYDQCTKEYNCNGSYEIKKKLV